MFTVADDYLNVGQTAGVTRSIDGFFTAPGFVSAHDSDGGTVDLNWGMRLLGEQLTFELSHPLNSGDGHDISLQLGDTVGFCMAYVRDGRATAETIFPPNCSNPQSNHGDIVIASSRRESSP